MARSPAIAGEKFSPDGGHGRRAAAVQQADDKGHPTASASAPGEREVFLDVLRAIAIVRVIAWHAFGVAAITYFIAAMPAMFFVTGSLLAKSMGRRRAHTVLFDRFRRLLIPLWAFGVVAWLAMALVALWSNDSLPLNRALAWVFPLTDPHGTAWEGGWLSSHLWYLRTLVWLLLASPLLLWAVRALRAFAFAVPIVAVFVLDVLAREAGRLPFSATTTWIVGDVALYSVFLMAGFLHRDGAFRGMNRRGWVVVALLAGAAAVAWRLTQPVPLGVVNNSHPLHLFVGSAWLALALAVQRTLGRLGARPLIGACVRAIGRRALTIYLWHTAAIIIAVNILEARRVDDPTAHAIGLVLLTTIGIVIATRLFGWVEDVAARRRRPAAPPDVRPVARPVAARPDPFALHRTLALASVVVLTGALLATTGSPLGVVAPEAQASTRAARRPPIPSKPPPAPVFRADDVASPPAEPPTPEEEDRLVTGLDELMREWVERTGVRGALLGVAMGPDIRWTAATGTRSEAGEPTTVNDRIDLASLTKLYTATLVHQAADKGLLHLSEPFPYLKALPDFPYDEGITVTQLLDHSSGLISYRDTTEYLDDWSLVDTPLAAIRNSLAGGRLAAPGEVYSYSSTNYLLLGLLLEEVTGRPYDDLLREGILEPLGLRETVHRPPVPGEPRGGTAGIETNLRDLLNTGIAILRDHRGLSEEAWTHLTTVDFENGYGPGTFGYCPCWIDENGMPQFFAIGHFGATTVLAYAPAYDMTIAVDLIDTAPGQDEFGPVPLFFEMLDDLVRRS